MTKPRLLLHLIILCPLFAFAGEDMKQWVLDNYTKREVMIPMRDGVRLFTAIYEPKQTAADTPKGKAGRHPILVERTPYTCYPYGEDKFAEYLWKSQAIYTRNRYILVFQDVRGKNHSEGDFEDVRPVVGNPQQNGKKSGKKGGAVAVDETTDTYDTVDWLVKNTRDNNGRVGFWGISNPGFYATMAGICGHPAVKAVSPQAPVTDWWMGDDIHHNGAFMLMDSYSFFPWFSRHNLLAPISDAARKKINLRDTDPYTRYLEAGAIKHLTARLDSCPLWDNVCKHPDYDEFWQQRDATRSITPATAKPAVMVVGGQFDAEDCWGALHTYDAFSKAKAGGDDVHFVFGPWSHGGWRGQCSSLGDIFFSDSLTTETFMRDIEYPFFAYYLEGKGARPAAVRAFSTGDNQWHNAPQWPVVATTGTPFYMHSGGKLTTKAPTTDEPSDTYTSDPMHPVPYQQTIADDRGTSYLCADQRFASYRPDVLTYQTQPLTDTLRLAGPIEADINVAISTTDADFVVKVIDVMPDGYENPKEKTALMAGYQKLVRGDIFRGRYRNSPSHPEAFTPGQPTQVRFTMPDVCHTFLPGHRLMVQVQSTWFPLADRNPQQFVDIYHCADSDFIASQITLNHTAEHPSLVRLPVVKGEQIDITGSRNGEVLLDTYYNHEIDRNGNLRHYTWDDTSWGGFSQFGEMIKAEGCALASLDAAPTAERLSKCRAYIIVDPDHVNDNPHPNFMTADEAKVIAQWVKRGGRLLVFVNDNKNCDIEHINLLTSIFGLNLNDNSILNLELPTKEHPDILYPLQGKINGVGRFFLRGTCSIRLTGKAEPLIWTPDNDVVMARAQYGKGSVIVVGDPWIYNEYIGHVLIPETFENAPGARYLVDFLTGSTH